MNRRSCLPLLCAGSLFLARFVHGQEGPFPPDAWPATARSDAAVHFVSVATDGVAPLAPLSETWVENSLTILGGGDQTTAEINIGGFKGLKATSLYFNVADQNYAFWNDYDTIDILMQVYGDSAVLSAGGTPRNFNFLIGTLPGSNLQAPVGGQLPVDAKNQRWNWVLFRISNTYFDEGSGFRRVGTKHPEAPGGSDRGGVNGGTIRIEGVEGLTVRTVAWGERGAFGEPDAINRFEPPEGCDPEPETNLASLDIAAGSANHLQVLNNGDQQTTLVEGVGPANDKRKAVKPSGSYVNFAITDNYLGLPCNEPRAVKVCVDYYDDPDQQGAIFGPEAFASDAKGAINFYPGEKRQTLEGTGKWVRRSWLIPDVNLSGVNVAPLTAGPRFFFTAPVAISRFELAVLRVGSHPLAGIDPLADCISDPNVCTEAYGSYAELDLATGAQNGLALGTSGGDQVYIQEEAGPENDRRLSVRPALDDGPVGFRHEYLNFAITGQSLGPSSQPNARLAICATYYDDPDLIGARFRPEVYWTEKNGVNALAFTGAEAYKILEGTGQWREAYFELPDVKFLGVNQGPQAAARFQLTGKIHISRLQYAVIRPCGPNAGLNQLENCKGVRLSLTRSPAGLRFSWPKAETGYSLETSPTLGAGAVWTTLAEQPTTEGNDWVITLPAANTGYYRLVK